MKKDKNLLTERLSVSLGCPFWWLLSACTMALAVSVECVQRERERKTRWRLARFIYLTEVWYDDCMPRNVTTSPWPVGTIPIHSRHSSINYTVRNYWARERERGVNLWSFHRRPLHNCCVCFAGKTMWITCWHEIYERTSFDSDFKE